MELTDRRHGRSPAGGQPSSPTTVGEGADAREDSIPSWTKNPHLGESFRYAFVGLATFAAHSPGHAAILVAFAAASVVAGLILGISLPEIALVIMAIVVVAVTEILNTGLEAAVDLVSPQYHDLAKAAKDMAAGAVLVSILGALIVGGLVFLPPLVQILAGSPAR